MAANTAQKAIPIDALNPQQLVMIKKNVEEVFTLDFNKRIKQNI